MKDSRTISVIIPVYNGEPYLAESIESALGQDYRPIEVIVVDDGSTDGSAEIAKRYCPSVRYFHQPNKGLGAALNQGIELARGDVFAFLDADDLWAQDKLSRQMAVLESNPEVDMVFGRVASFFGAERNETGNSALSGSGETTPACCKGAMLVGREAFFRVGLFSTRWKLGDFVDWYARATETGLKSVTLPETVLMRRVHNANQGIREREFRKDYAHILKAALDRRRRKDA